MPNQKRRKLEANSVTGYLVGYCDNTDSYRVYNPELDTTVLSHDVIFKDDVETVCEQT